MFHFIEKKKPGLMRNGGKQKKGKNKKERARHPSLRAIGGSGTFIADSSLRYGMRTGIYQNGGHTPTRDGKAGRESKVGV